jgi:hypothetical protein
MSEPILIVITNSVISSRELVAIEALPFDKVVRIDRCAIVEDSDGAVERLRSKVGKWPPDATAYHRRVDDK